MTAPTIGVSCVTIRFTTLSALAEWRLYFDTTLPQANASMGGRHISLVIRDQLGSSSIMLDHASGELIERTTYTPYGAVENDFRPPSLLSSIAMRLKGTLMSSQNMTGRNIAILIIRPASNDVDDIRRHVPNALVALQSLKSGS
jgi:hypothetical protein